jgi:hypothetical protein
VKLDYYVFHDLFQHFLWLLNFFCSFKSLAVVPKMDSNFSVGRAKIPRVSFHKNAGQMTATKYLSLRKHNALSIFSGQ